MLRFGNGSEVGGEKGTGGMLIRPFDFSFRHFRGRSCDGVDLAMSDWASFLVHLLL